MSGIIKPKVVNSLLLNNELGQDFITHYSSAPIFGKYGKEVFTAPTHLPINFSINGTSNNILPNYLINSLKFKYIIGEINPKLFKYISKLIFDNPQLLNEFSEENTLNEIIASIHNKKNEFNYNLSSDGILNEADIPQNVSSKGALVSDAVLETLLNESNNRDKELENLFTAEIDKINEKQNEISEFLNKTFDIQFN